MPCLPLYRLLVAAALLTGAVGTARFEHARPSYAGPSHPCPHGPGIRACAPVATTADPVAARPPRAEAPAAPRVAS